MSIAVARADLKATLEDTGYTVNAYGKARFIAPAIFIDEDIPFIEYGDVMQRGVMRINFKVLLVLDSKNIESSTKNMDEMLLTVLENLGDWSLTNMESHYIARFQENGPTYLVTSLNVTNNLRIGGY